MEASSSKGEKRKQSESKGPQSHGTSDTSTKKKKQAKIEETVMGDQTKHEEKDEVARAEGAAPSTKKRQRKQGDGAVEETEQAQPAKKAKKATLTKALANTRFQSTPRTKLQEIKAAAKAHSKLSDDFGNSWRTREVAGLVRRGMTMQLLALLVPSMSWSHRRHQSHERHQSHPRRQGRHQSHPRHQGHRRHQRHPEHQSDSRGKQVALPPVLRL